MGDAAASVPVEVRSHELSQLQDITPRIIDTMRESGVDSIMDEAEELGRVYEEHIEGLERVHDNPEDAYATHLSMPADDWQTLIRHLNRARKGQPLRVHWLQTKLVDRVEDRAEAVL